MQFTCMENGRQRCLNNRLQQYHSGSILEGGRGQCLVRVPVLHLRNTRKTNHNKTPFHSCLCYTNCGVMISISAAVLYTIRVTYTVISHCCVTFYSLLCSYSHKHNYIAQGYKLRILGDVSSFLVFIKLCLHTSLLIYVAPFLLKITAKYNRVYHS